MTKVSDAQSRILKAASKQPKTDVREFMNGIKSPAIRDKVVNSMLKNGLIAEDPDAEGVVYVISDAGYEAIGKTKPKEESPGEKPAKKTAPKKREGKSKKQIMIDLMSRKGGATRKELMDATGWQKHSVQGGTSNLRDELIEKQGLTIISEGEGSDRVYKIVKHDPKQEATEKKPNKVA